MDKGSRIRLSKLAVKLISVGGVVVLIVAAIFIWWYMAVSHKSSDDRRDTAAALPVAATVCQDDIIQQAAPLIAAHGMLALSSLVEVIEKRENYKNDANCNYILVSFYTNTGDTTKAQRALDDMLRARNAGSVMSLQFDPAVPPVETLQSAIDVQKKLQEQAETERQRSAELYNRMDQAQ
jgi:hypothetical protein